mgnify:CR=1 FL=1
MGSFNQMPIRKLYSCLTICRLKGCASIMLSVMVTERQSCLFQSTLNSFLCMMSIQCIAVGTVDAIHASCIVLVLGFCGYFEPLVSAMMAGLLLSSRETVASECKIRRPLSSMRFTYAGNQGVHDLHEHSTTSRKNI